MSARTKLPLVALLMLAGCVSAGSRTPQPVAQQTQAVTANAAGLQSVMGRGARALIALFGQPALDIHEADARKLQFAGPACVLDTYLYPSRNGSEPVVTHVDARLPDGRDMDRASCVAALTAQQQTR